MKKILLNLFLVCFFLSFSVLAFDVPLLSGPVVDRAHMLNSHSKNQIEEFIYNLHKKTGVQIQVLTVESLYGESIEAASIQVTDEWKIGSEKEDKGVLLMISKNDRAIRIEVGQGLEGNIPDAVAKRIIEDVIKPHFRNSNFDLGVRDAVLSIAQYALPGHELLKGQTLGSKRHRTLTLPPLLRIILIIFFVIFIRTNLFTFLFGSFLAKNILGGRSSSRGLFGGGGGFGGGGWSGGGGGFSGGGASGRW